MIRRSIKLPMNRLKTNVQHSTLNAQRRRTRDSPIRRSVLGVGCSMFAAQKGSSSLSSSKRNRPLPMNRESQLPTLIERRHSPSCCNGCLRLPLTSRRQGSCSLGTAERDRPLPMNRGRPTGESLNRGVSRRKARRRAECGCTNLCGPPREPPCPSVVNPRPGSCSLGRSNGMRRFPSNSSPVLRGEVPPTGRIFRHG